MLTVKRDSHSTPPISPSHHSNIQWCSLNNNWQISRDDRNILDMDENLGKILPDHYQSSVWSDSEMTPCSTSFSTIASNCTPNSKSSMELVKEINYLETEILRLEGYLLSLYRTAFHQSPIKKVNADSWSNGQRGQLSNHQTSSYTKERKTSRCSLGDHLGNSCTENAILDRPDRLSEDIIKCISLIYCKLGDQDQTRFGPSVSSASSMSSSGTNCTRSLSDTWSPYCNEEGSPYTGMVEVLKINVDDDDFSYASRMLKKFRTLVKKLEKVDPRKMKREQKLVFWINIHNALVMHAYLAYGTHSNTKTNSILKASYNIGGHSINAYIIQVSILGIKSHFEASWLQSLLSPGRKMKTEQNKHIYAIDYTEPLVHFALSLGAFSDPVVRVYNAKNIFQDLRLAKEEFIRSTVYVNKETRIHLPKIIYYFAKDMALSMSSLLEMVKSCLSESQPKVKKLSSNGKPEKCIYWLSQSCIFRYMIHRDTVVGRLSV